MKKFDLGDVVFTPGTEQLFSDSACEIGRSLARHVSGGQKNIRRRF